MKTNHLSYRLSKVKQLFTNIHLVMFWSSCPYLQLPESWNKSKSSCQVNITVVASQQLTIPCTLEAVRTNGHFLMDAGNCWHSGQPPETRGFGFLETHEFFWAGAHSHDVTGYIGRRGICPSRQSPGTNQGLDAHREYWWVCLCSHLIWKTGVKESKVYILNLSSPSIRFLFCWVTYFQEKKLLIIFNKN